ncbi:4-phosphoerythronate dehydrogenase [Glaciecola sp. MH2013]|uniref:4-phosphoerythronate dehydrogenase n=1 Tax=Glaciecola sp. MH2013 TaxID=2785524 RepID=UPI0018A08DE5|nr:4-phosphoerythronate dehydrogenase [Glaciecola sp. MH2013]MBF7072523.1 4-phosphoerythronate dehydrogenase [Glaciecola sp. MH2013]
MNILYDAAMPYAENFFADLGEATAFESGKLRPEQLSETNALMVRSTTKVDKALLSYASKLEFVGTATAGINHFDLPELNRRGIKWCSAAGCNAIAVAEYVVSAIYHLAYEDSFLPQTKKVAIVGAGNVGTALALRLQALQIDYVLYDPPLQAKGDSRHFVSFGELLSADIICLHVPLVEDGEHPTRNMISDSELRQISEAQYLINACRGEVINNRALLEAFNAGKKLNVILDVWEGEPYIEHRLIPFVRFATAHIAGHTLEGKARGTSMLYDQFCEWKGLEKQQQLATFLPNYQNCPTLLANKSTFEQIFHVVKHMYNIKMDDGNFRSRMAKSEAFADIRKNYQIRREFSAATLYVDTVGEVAGELPANSDNNIALKQKEAVQIARELGFLIAN